ncbi:ABC transporter permease [Salinibacterium sp. NSLL150]|uniref:ABC transporter permease n=1 Tax=unclassified Salinibacterium TaxID=2632331 RepID=UPI0018CE3DFB|nr:MULTISPECIES: ABC transporter permease [unclassified Salinibacterium]MBH0098891.1 ABC transporter permease [Salinibacterium sp. NSLL35]MBH0101646.1 ABC transporter permease [Salinibacterium sp. NSLL150]MBH0104405.1 ABC transporter permease [Salinibacterium sp. NSLL16]MBH0107166.1 ABC transporter permease [Salinibacterium sp. NSLL17]MBH0109054.1 ABC transporter permease [Salinibacterium sp. NG22]
MTWIINNLDLIWGLTLEHVRLSILPIVLGFLISIPLGWLAYRFKLTRGILLTLAGLLYTIPSLALFVILPPFLGISFLSELNITIALTLYAVAIMARSVADALASVDPAIRQSATAVGFGGWRRFWTVDFPLAGPVVLAGLRVAAVSTVSLVTVGILIGVESLGYLFTNGFQRRILEEIFAGVVMTVIVALLIDRGLVLLGRLLMPWASVSKKKSPAPALEGAPA